jgi:hypothetical protein
LEAASQGHLPATGHAEALENTLERVANAVMALREQVAMTCNKVITKHVECLATSGRALLAGVPGEEWQAEPPPQ